MSDEWGPWIEHDGLSCPKGEYAQWVWDNGVLREGIAGTNHVNFATGKVIGPDKGAKTISWIWATNPRRRVIRYRIRKPRGLAILENLIADLPAPVRPEVDA